MLMKLLRTSAWEAIANCAAACGCGGVQAARQMQLAARLVGRVDAKVSECVERVVVACMHAPQPQWTAGCARLLKGLARYHVATPQASYLRSHGSFSCSNEQNGERVQHSHPKPGPLHDVEGGVHDEVCAAWGLAEPAGPATPDSLSASQ